MKWTLILLIALGSQFAQAQGTITHIIVIIQENRSFYEYFGHLPGTTDALNPPVACSTALGSGTPCPNGGSGFVTPVCHMTDPTVDTLCGDHTHQGSINAIDGGLMDGFGLGSCTPLVVTSNCYDYYTATELPLYYSWAQYYATNDHFFSAMSGPSKPNHFVLYAATMNGGVDNENNMGGGAFTDLNQWTSQMLDSGSVIPVAGACTAGTRSGATCLTNSDCPGSTCNLTSSVIPAAYTSDTNTNYPSNGVVAANFISETAPLGTATRQHPGTCGSVCSDGPRAGLFCNDSSGCTGVCAGTGCSLGCPVGGNGNLRTSCVCSAVAGDWPNGGGQGFANASVSACASNPTRANNVGACQQCIDTTDCTGVSPSATCQMTKVVGGTYGIGGNIAPAVTTLGDIMTTAGVSWKWYGSAISFNGRQWVAPCYTQDCFTAENDFVVDRSVFFTDCNNNTLPQVVFISPNNDESEHGGYGFGPATGVTYVASFLNCIFTHPAIYNHSVIVVYHDDFGGHYDPVQPPVMSTVLGTPLPAYDNIGVGMRVPNMVIGPYVIRGVNHTIMTPDSITRYIEQTFGLSSLTTRDANANSLGLMINLSQNPIPPPPIAPAPFFAKRRGPEDVVSGVRWIAARVHDKKNHEDEGNNEAKHDSHFTPQLAMLRNCEDGYKMLPATYYSHVPMRPQEIELCFWHGDTLQGNILRPGEVEGDADEPDKKGGAN